MSGNRTSPDLKALPKPMTLTPEQLRQIAAGTAALLPAALLPTIIAGPYPVGPLWGPTHFQSVAPLLAGANLQLGG